MSSEAMPADLLSGPQYRGRFAPSPTGPLHFGSLVAAVASYAQAMHHQGEWLVRIEDIDPTREVSGAAASILRSLDAHGFNYPEPVFQSTRLDAYRAALDTLVDQGAAFHCSCTRQQLLKTATRGRAGMIYPGTCREGADESARPAVSIRLLTEEAMVSFTDGLQGEQSCAVGTEIGDFLLRRGDGHIAYQLAVALDDAEQHITEVFRGTDLLDSTFMQRLVLEKLGKKMPDYAHFPVVTGADGRKLSKQTGAPKLDNNCPNINLLRALSFLLQEPPESLRNAPLTTLWAWVGAHWNPRRLEAVQSRPETGIMVQ